MHTHITVGCELNVIVDKDRLTLSNPWHNFASLAGDFRARKASRRGENKRFSSVFVRERREKRVDSVGSVVSRLNYVPL